MPWRGGRGSWEAVQDLKRRRELWSHSKETGLLREKEGESLQCRNRIKEQQEFLVEKRERTTHAYLAPEHGTEDGEERKMAKKEEGLFLACAQTGKSETGTKEELRIADHVHHLCESRCSWGKLL